MIKSWNAENVEIAKRDVSDLVLRISVPPVYSYLMFEHMKGYMGDPAKESRDLD